MKGQKIIDISPKEKELELSVEDIAFFGHRDYRQFQSYTEIEKEFDRWAFGATETCGFTYDDLAQFFQYNAPQKLANFALLFLEQFQEPHILDVGCGTGKSG